MSHIGLICPELSGHLNPMTTLGRELKRRGHRVTVVARPDARRKAEGAGLGFAAIDAEGFPEGSMRATSAELGRLSGLSAIQFTAELLRRGAAAILRDAPEIITGEKIDAWSWIKSRRRAAPSGIGSGSRTSRSAMRWR